MRLIYTLRRGANGLGIDVGKENTIVEVVANGQAAADGVAQPGDVIEAIDGVAIAPEQTLPQVMVPGRESYEVLVSRFKPGALATQALAAGLLRSAAAKDKGGAQPKQPVRLVGCRVRRGPDGIGLDLGPFNRVMGLVPGSPADDDGIILLGDVIAAVDGQLVGSGSLPPLLSPPRPSYRIVVMRAEGESPDAAAADAAAGATPGTAVVASAAPKVRPLTEAELDLVLDGPSGGAGRSPPSRVTGAGGEAEATGPVWRFRNGEAAEADNTDDDDDNDDSNESDESDESDDDGGGGDGGVASRIERKSAGKLEAFKTSAASRRKAGRSGKRRAAPQLSEEKIVEEDEDADDADGPPLALGGPGHGSTALVVAEGGDGAKAASLDVLWDVDSCPIAASLPPAASPAGAGAPDLVPLLQRQRLRLQTACAQGAPLASVVAFGEFGQLTDSALAQALVSTSFQVVGCGAPGECARGGVACALQLAMSLRVLDGAKQPLLVVSARPEIHLAVTQLVARGCDVRLAAPADALTRAPSAVLQDMRARAKNRGTEELAVRSYRWPQLYALTGKEE